MKGRIVYVCPRRSFDLVDQHVYHPGSVEKVWIVMRQGYIRSSAVALVCVWFLLFLLLHLGWF